MRVPITGKLTATWDEPRPLSNPGEHVHGAWDIQAAVGAVIQAPEAGHLYYAAIFRNDLEDGERPTWDDMSGFPWQNYFYDVYGGLILLEGDSGMVHVFAHSYFNQLHDKGIIPCSAWEYAEEQESKRWPIHCMHTMNSNYIVQEGETIGYVGNAGYSTGPHVHWEIHNGWQLDDYEDRVNPATLDLFKGKR